MSQQPVGKREGTSAQVNLTGGRLQTRTIAVAVDLQDLTIFMERVLVFLDGDAQGVLALWMNDFSRLVAGLVLLRPKARQTFRREGRRSDLPILERQ